MCGIFVASLKILDVLALISRNIHRLNISRHAFSCVSSFEPLFTFIHNIIQQLVALSLPLLEECFDLFLSPTKNVSSLIQCQKKGSTIISQFLTDSYGAPSRASHRWGADRARFWKCWCAERLSTSCYVSQEAWFQQKQGALFFKWEK